MNFILKNKKQLLFFILAGFFLTNTIVAELVGVKIFSLEETLGFKPFDWELFGTTGLGLNLTAGVLLWPIVFVLTDVINEYFGPKVIKYLSYATIVLVFYAFAMIYLAIHLSPNEWWANESGINLSDPSLSIKNMDLAFNAVMGQGMKIIIASMIAFLIGQVLDAYIFHRIKKITGEKKIWLRATGSTLISQWIDSYVVLIIAFYFLSNWDLTTVLAIGTVNYFYKFTVAILMTPLIYLAHYVIDNWLGNEMATHLKQQAQL